MFKIHRALLNKIQQLSSQIEHIVRQKCYNREKLVVSTQELKHTVDDLYQNLNKKKTIRSSAITVIKMPIHGIWRGVRYLCRDAKVALQKFRQDQISHSKLLTALLQTSAKILATAISLSVIFWFTFASFNPALVILITIFGLGIIGEKLHKKEL